MIVSISVVGRLSTTYQAEVLEHVGGRRPARSRQPGDEHDLSHDASVVLRRISSAARTTAAGTPHWPRTRAPGRGTPEAAPVRASVVHREPARCQRVHVARHRPVDEPDPHAELDLLDRLALDEVGPEPPVLLGRIDHVVVDPAAAGRLQDRVIEEEAERPPGWSTLATSAIASSTSSMCSNTRHATAASNEPSANGSAAAPHAAYAAPPPRSAATRSEFQVGSIPTTRLPELRSEAADLAVATPDVEHAPAPSSSAAASGRICSSYSGSAPSVNPSIHQSACVLPQISVSVSRTSQRTVGAVKFSVWPNPSPAPPRCSTSPDGRRRRLALPLVRRPLHAEHRRRVVRPATSTSAGRSCPRSQRSPTACDSARSSRPRRSITPRCSPTARRRSTSSRTAAWCSASAPAGRSTNTAAYGIELEAPGTRVSRFEESIQIVRSLLDNDRTDFHGDFYDITDAPCDPKPVQRPLPILVGTGSPRMLRITARHATSGTRGAHPSWPPSAGQLRRRHVTPSAPTRVDAPRCRR